MIIYIDEKEILVKDTNRNIVEIAGQNGISMIAPCFRNNRRLGCCNACVIEVNGVQQFACVTKPTDGMRITYKRDDLIALRKAQLVAYVQAFRNGEKLECNCGCGNVSDASDGASSCGCSDSDCCG